MAKSSNGLGKFSGKLGGSVFVIRNGQQIVREYNPAPANPKTYLQSAQRAKGNLAGRISSFTPKAAIFGLGYNAPTRRSRFLKILLKAASVTQSGDAFRAKIADEDVFFSEGSVTGSVYNPVFSAVANSISVTLTGYETSIIPPDVYQSRLTRLVVMVYDATTQDLVEVVTKVANKPAQSETATTFFNITHRGGYTAVVYALPMSTEDGSAVSVNSDLAERDDSAIAASLSLNGNAVVFAYGKSYVLGQAAFTPTA